ncbi:MAG: response regulator [Desulfarculaceae bacterium]|jgi:DNA-binding response OmpR family regulator
MSVPDEPLRLLLVDDEPAYLEVLEKRMGMRGLEVTTAGSGADGIQALRKQDFEVAVVDLKLGDMDGLEVLKVFKKMDPQIQVIILTGHGSEQAARDGLAMGAFDYLTKPCELESLLERIKAARAQRQLGGDGSVGAD